MMKVVPDRGFAYRHHFVAEGVRSVFETLEVAKRKGIPAPVSIWKFVRYAEADFAKRVAGARENVEGGLLYVNCQR